MKTLNFLTSITDYSETNFSMFRDTQLVKLALSQPSKIGTARKLVHAFRITARREAWWLG